MMQSLFSGFTGMRTQQRYMDVIGNNIANVNTTGYKAARVNFEDLLYTSMRAADASTNPVQVGSGVRVGAIDTLWGQGIPSSTGNLHDVAIIGDGFLVVQGGDQQFYTRAGSLSFDSEGYLIHTATGHRVMGWNADANGKVTAGLSLRELRAKPGTVINGVASTGVSFSGVFDARLDVGSEIVRDVTVIDAQGRSHVLTVTFTRQTDTEWGWSAASADGSLSPASGTISFNAVTGEFDTSDVSQLQLNLTGETLTLALDFAGCHQVGTDASVSVDQVGGMMAGTLRDVTIDEFGRLIGNFTNGTNRVLGQIALATFTNNNGLQRVGTNLYAATMASGAANTDAAPGVGRGTFSPGSLEMSNVDLTQEFSSMILSQRAFQASSRVVTTTDELLQEVVNLRR